VAVTLAPIAAVPALSMRMQTVTATLASGSDTPVGGYQFTLVPNADVATLPLATSGNTATFRAPGRFDGCTVTIKVDALNSDGSVASTQNAVYTVSKHSDYIRRGGKWVAISAPALFTPAAPASNGITTSDGSRLVTSDGDTITYT
jgi:hypothetical protein